jgi:hypothetical protein
MSTAAHLPAPFPSSNALNIEQLDHCNPHRQKSATSPLSAEHITYVPGEPTIKLVTAEVDAYLSNELDTVLLDEVYDHLWLVAGKSGRSIDALHAQKIKGRSIIATEDHRLHLTWHRNKFYVKPVPVCLLNHEFWTIYLSSSERMDVYPTGSQKTCQSVASSFDRSIAVGFLRSYAFLVQHRLDFILAKELHLVPDEVDWIKWSIFISNFRDLKDDQVAKRYHYGQLRLSRLSWTVRLFGAGHSRTTSFYGLPYWTTTEYMTELTFGLLFFFWRCVPRSFIDAGGTRCANRRFVVSAARWPRTARDAAGILGFLDRCIAFSNSDLGPTSWYTNCCLSIAISVG